ncbi:MULTISPECIES: hypothetical protein [Actinomycetes]|uniref:hypothetical protein n=1 Tax=unclassified Nocardia TaxID=2637762 RepID=UPI0033BC531F
MHPIGSRKRNQPAPPHAVYAALTNPDRDPTRPWLILLPDEQRPTILEHNDPDLVIWSSLWPKHPTARIRFDLPTDGRGGTDLRWTLYIDTPNLDDSAIGHLRYRLNTLINANLRYSFGQ